MGKSIPEIMSGTNLSKTTVWYHVRNIKLATDLGKRIRSRQGGSTKRRVDDLKAAQLDAEQIVSMSSEARSISFVVAALYWAEGSKREFVFTNTDEYMIRTYLLFLRKYLNVPEDDISILIRISDPIKPAHAISYWKKATGLKNLNIKINHNNVQNKTKTTYGICRVMVKKSGYYLKIMYCIMDAVKKEFLPLYSNYTRPAFGIKI